MLMEDSRRIFVMGSDSKINNDLRLSIFVMDNLLPIAYIVLLVDDIENGRPVPSTFQWQKNYQDRMKTC
jgi:hypothetical protein